MIPLDKMPGSKVLSYLLTGLALIVPGIGYMHIVKPELLTLQPIIVILIAIVYSTPLYILGLLDIVLDKNYTEQVEEMKKKKEDPYVKQCFLASIFTFGAFFLSVVYIELFNKNPHFTLLNIMYLVAIFTVGLTIFDRICSGCKKK